MSHPEDHGFNNSTIETKQQQHHQNSLQQRKLTPYNIDYIVKDLGNDKRKEIDVIVGEKQETHVPGLCSEEKYYTWPNQTKNFSSTISNSNAQEINSNYLPFEAKNTEAQTDVTLKYGTDCNSRIVKIESNDVQNLEYKDIPWKCDEQKTIISKEPVDGPNPNVGQMSYQLHIIDAEPPRQKIILPPKKNFLLEQLKPQKIISEVVPDNDDKKVVILEDITIRSILGLNNSDETREEVSATDKHLKLKRPKCDKTVPVMPFKIAPVASINIPVPQKSKQFQNMINSVYTSADKCAEVKHARTPVQKTSNALQTHITPQLPTPSPNYPESSNCHTNQLPNNSNTTNVPIAKLVNHRQQPHNGTSQVNNNKLVNNAHSMDLNKKIVGGCKAMGGRPKKSRSHKAVSTRPDGSNFTVLNIPNLRFQTAQAPRRVKISRIESAMRRRRKRKLARQANRLKKIARTTPPTTDAAVDSSVVTFEWGIPVVGYNSDTSSSCNSSDYDSDTCLVDLEIRSGPVEKPTPEKIGFLNGFGLATPSQSNCKLL